MGIKLKTKGELKKTKKFLYTLTFRDYRKLVEEAGQMGVDALNEATPKRTGKTAASWYYEINQTSDGFTIVWKNSNKTKTGDCIAILIQYGHGTPSGGYVKGVDYINPAMEPVFEYIENKLWKAVTES